MRKYLPFEIERAQVAHLNGQVIVTDEDSHPAVTIVTMTNPPPLRVVGYYEDSEAGVLFGQWTRDGRPEEDDDLPSGKPGLLLEAEMTIEEELRMTQAQKRDLEDELKIAREERDALIEKIRGLRKGTLKFDACGEVVTAESILSPFDKIDFFKTPKDKVVEKVIDYEMLYKSASERANIAESKCKELTKELIAKQRELNDCRDKQALNDAVAESLPL